MEDLNLEILVLDNMYNTYNVARFVFPKVVVNGWPDNVVP